MERLVRYFSEAQVCQPEARRIGIETETLFVDRETGQPISLEVSQGIVKALRDGFGWQMGEEKNGLIVELRKNGFAVFYELGWNNFELTTAAFFIGDDCLFSEHNELFKELDRAASFFGAKSIEGSWDGHLSNTLIVPDKRDEVWIELDGSALNLLGHIAAVHFNIDLVSIEEGIEWIRKLNSFFSKVGWPPRENFSIWRKYLVESTAKYEIDRYGPSPTPKTLQGYCQKLASYKVVMNNENGELVIARPARPFKACQKVDLDLFLRSVWWYPRLRVRNGRLVLEIRDIPRKIKIEQSLQSVRDILEF